MGFSKYFHVYFADLESLFIKICGNYCWECALTAFSVRAMVVWCGRLCIVLKYAMYTLRRSSDVMFDVVLIAGVDLGRE